MSRDQEPDELPDPADAEMETSAGGSREALEETGAENGNEAGAGGDGGPAAEPLIRLSQQELERCIEAVLFSSGEPVPIRQLAELFETSVHDIREAIEELRLAYVNNGHAFRLEDIAGGLQILTLPKYDPWVRRYLSRARDTRLSPAAFETLAVIAYKQPITKADLEAIRGVQCAPILKTLLDKHLVKVVGREESLGKPLLYGTTKRFLESFGLSSITGLPQPELAHSEQGASSPLAGALAAAGAAAGALLSTAPPTAAESAVDEGPVVDEGPPGDEESSTDPE